MDSQFSNLTGPAARAKAPESGADLQAVIDALMAIRAPHKSPRPNQTAAGDGQAGEALPPIADRYNVLVEQIPAVIFMILLDGSMSETYVSPQLEQILGFSGKWVEDPIRWYHQIHPDDRARWSKDAAELLLTGKPLNSGYRVLARDGHVVWFHCEARQVNREDGQPWFIHGAAIDVSDLKRTEVALLAETAERERLEELEIARQLEIGQQAESRLAAIVESSDDAIVSKNINGIISSWNKSAELMFGYTAAEAIGKHITLIVPSDRLDEEASILERLRRGERIEHFETVRLRKDGVRLNVSISISPLRNASGAIIGAAKVARDITQRKRNEEALRQSEEKYRRLAETLESQVLERTRELESRNREVLRQSDELRTLSFQLLKAQDDERRHLARELHDSAGQTLAILGMSLDQIVRQVQAENPSLTKHAEETLELVKQLNQEVRTASYLLHPPLLDETGIAAALSWYMEGLQKRTGLAIRLDVPKTFGRLPAEMELLVFRFVQECLTNVHRHSGSKTAAIRVARTAAEVFVEVEDQGKGIPPEKIAVIQSQGSGVGIRGMRERLRHFQGELRIESQSSGTRISATIPLPKETGPHP